jgi:NADPH2:quinone reductase
LAGDLRLFLCIGAPQLECGSGVTAVAPGDRVAVGTRSGGWAEEVVAPEATVWRLPEAVDFLAAAHFPTIYATAYAALGVLGAVCGLDAVEFHLILLENFDQVTDLVDHAAYCGCVFQLAGAANFAQAQAAHGSAVGLSAANRTANQLNLNGGLCNGLCGGHTCGSC